MSSYIPERVDKVKRPDHYKCLECGEKFNDAKLVKEEIEGIFVAQATCPACDSTELKVSWWRKKNG